VLEHAHRPATAEPATAPAHAGQLARDPRSWHARPSGRNPEREPVGAKVRVEDRLLEGTIARLHLTPPRGRLVEIQD